MELEIAEGSWSVRLTRAGSEKGEDQDGARVEMRDNLPALWDVWTLERPEAAKEGLEGKA